VAVVTQRKLWRTAKRWVPHEWVTKKEAWLRVHTALSENIELTRRDLKAYLLAKRLVGAARVIAPDGSERCIIFEPAFWGPVELTFAWSMTGREKYVSEGETWYFFVRRRELDRRYPATAASEQPTTPTAQPAHDDVQPTPQRPKPGQKIKKGWRLTAAVELDGFIKEKGRRPSGPELAQRVDKKLKYYPDESDVRKLMRFLLDDE
jgi:hypothetical protein